MLQIVWFKRDLRVQDHAPLSQAAACGPVLPLYIVEPVLWRQPDMSDRHWCFVVDCLRTLDRALTGRGQPLVVRCGDVLSILSALRREHGAFALWSHEETGNGWSFARDRAVGAWCRANAVQWNELPNHGVFRGLSERRGWSRRWEARMAEPLNHPPSKLPQVVHRADLTLDAALARMPSADRFPLQQGGGWAQAEQMLNSFLRERGHDYHRAMSSPLTAERSCSRLSAHLAWGTLSMREVVRKARSARATLDPEHAAEADQRRALQAFLGRLHWHCHFIQKLESEPRIEFENLHSAYNGLREGEWQEARFAAWCEGRTGWPFVDACMRYLRATGWLNFRMRAMLVSVASYQLWLHWRPPALFLARQFTDYEPGIHYSQMQMQSGTTGINTPRVYNPIKQGKEHDPTGIFVRRWVPELAGVPERWIHEPWLLSADARIRFGAADYPPPMVDHLSAARYARQNIGAVRRRADYRDEADAIQQRHGSRRSGMAYRGGSKPRASKPEQGSVQRAFDWGASA